MRAAVGGVSMTNYSCCVLQGLAVKPSCINRAAVAGLRRHLAPRAVYVITSTPRQCVAFRSWGANVHCHTQVEAWSAASVVHWRVAAGCHGMPPLSGMPTAAAQPAVCKLCSYRGCMTFQDVYRSTL